MNQLFLITREQRSSLDEAMGRLAEWMGLIPTFVTAPQPSTPLMPHLLVPENTPIRMTFSADTLAWLLEGLQSASPALALFSNRPVQCFIYGFQLSPRHTAALQALAGQSIAGITSVTSGPLRFRFSSSGKEWLQQLTGLDFLDETGLPCDAFVLPSSSPDPNVVPLLSIENHPVFLLSRPAKNSQVFLWATDRVADVDATIPPNVPFESSYRWLLPAIIYLKASFGPYVWHNPHQRARLIIDDPLLQPRYGFLQYENLLASMQSTTYATSLAFIPWNHRRSNQAVAKMFVSSPDHLSLCVHGCDHTNHEFDASDEDELSGKALLALQRMDDHQQRSRVPYEKIMVFPQGHFSVPAVKALRRSGFLAAVNSTCYPNRTETPLSLGDLLLPAICHIYGFPLFPRRDPIHLFDVAVDLFLGKAGLIVEHHEFVRDGFGKWEQFVKQMNAMDTRLSWPSLIDTVTETCLQKVAGEHRWDVRFFTQTFRWRNQSSQPVTAQLSKFEPEPTHIQKVHINGQARPFDWKDELLTIEELVAPQSTIEVTLQEQLLPPSPFKPSLNHRVRVGIRRVLSELRDNQLARYPHLLGYAKGLVRQLGLTSDSHRNG